METKEQRLKRLAEAMAKAVGRANLIQEIHCKKIASKDASK